MPKPSVSTNLFGGGLVELTCYQCIILRDLEQVIINTDHALQLLQFGGPEDLINCSRLEVSVRSLSSSSFR